MVVLLIENIIICNLFLQIVSNYNYDALFCTKYTSSDTHYKTYDNLHYTSVITDHKIYDISPYTSTRTDYEAWYISLIYFSRYLKLNILYTSPYTSADTDYKTYDTSPSTSADTDYDTWYFPTYLYWYLLYETHSTSP